MYGPGLSVCHRHGGAGLLGAIWSSGAATLGSVCGTVVNRGIWVPEGLCSWTHSSLPTSFGRALNSGVTAEECDRSWSRCGRAMDLQLGE